MCSVDLFPMPDSAYEAQSSTPSQSPPSASPSSYRHDSPAGQPEASSSSPSSTLTYFPLHPYTSFDINGPQTPISPFQIPRRQLMLGHLHPSSMPPDVVHQRGTHLVTESSKLTPALVGEKYVEPTFVEFEGRNLLVFVFCVSICCHFSGLGARSTTKARNGCFENLLLELQDTRVARN